MKVNIKETMDILNAATKVTIKHCEKKNLTFTVLKSMSVRNYIKMGKK
jgi:hypothetical protein